MPAGLRVRRADTNDGIFIPYEELAARLRLDGAFQPDLAVPLAGRIDYNGPSASPSLPVRPLQRRTSAPPSVPWRRPRRAAPDCGPQWPCHCTSGSNPEVLGAEGIKVWGLRVFLDEGRRKASWQCIFQYKQSRGATAKRIKVQIPDLRAEGGAACAGRRSEEDARLDAGREGRQAGIRSWTAASVRSQYRSHLHTPPPPYQLTIPLAEKASPSTRGIQWERPTVWSCGALEVYMNAAAGWELSVLFGCPVPLAGHEACEHGRSSSTLSRPA